MHASAQCGGTRGLAYEKQKGGWNEWWANDWTTAEPVIHRLDQIKDLGGPPCRDTFVHERCS